MSSLIERQAAIDALVKAIREDPCYDSNEAINGLGVCDVRVILNDLPSAQQWIPCSEKMPPDYQWYYATCKSLVDNRENWVVEGCYTPWEHFNSTPMIKCGKAEVIAWMPKGFPEPWKGEQDG